MKIEFDMGYEVCTLVERAMQAGYDNQKETTEVILRGLTWGYMFFFQLLGGLDFEQFTQMWGTIDAAIKVYLNDRFNKLEEGCNDVQ